MVKGKASSYMGGGYKRAFDLQRFAQVDNPYEFDIDTDKLADSIALIDLAYYARDNIANYQTITEIPQENIEYLSSGLSAGSCYSMFMYCRQLTSIPWNEFNIDTSQVTDMSYMFYSCRDLTSLDLSNIDTSKVTNMCYMFDTCRGLTSLDLSNIDTSKVTNMDSIFAYCQFLTSLDLSNIDTSKVTNMNSMFYYCTSLQEIICPNGFDLSSCTDVSYMFRYCNSYGDPLHFKNVPRDLDFSRIEGTEDTHYVIDSYKD